MSSNSSLSIYCLSNLFELCSGKEVLGVDPEVVGIKKKIARTTTPIMLN